MASLKASQTTLFPIHRKELRTRDGHLLVVGGHLNVRQRPEIQSQDSRNRRRPSLRFRSRHLPRCHRRHQAHHLTRIQRFQLGPRLHHTQPSLLQNIGQRHSRNQAGRFRPRRHHQSVPQLQLEDPTPLESLPWCTREPQRQASRTDRKRNTKLLLKTLLPMVTEMPWISTILRLKRYRSRRQRPPTYLRDLRQGP